jgi:hypothetical protein
MKRRDFLMLSGFSILYAKLWHSAGSSVAIAAPVATEVASASAGLAQTQAVAAATTRFLGLLSEEQREAIHFPFVVQPKATAALFKGGKGGDVLFTGEEYGHSMWSNFPISDVPRPGLRLGSLSQTQHDAVLALLRILLSERGFRKVGEIMGSDQALADKGTNYASGRDAYTLAIFGAPASETPWMLQFGGHHLALNVAMLGEHGVLSPVLTGCLPAIYTENGKTIRVLAAENDKAFALVDTLDDQQRAQVMIDHPVSELALGPGHDGETMSPVGLRGSALSVKQQGMLFDLILEWAGILNDAHAAPRIAEIKGGLEETYFAWSGSDHHELDRNGASYFRIQGPKLFIEFSPQQVGGDTTMHVHTIYRDAENAYGRGLTA